MKEREILTLELGSWVSVTLISAGRRSLLGPTAVDEEAGEANLRRNEGRLDRR